MKKKIVRSLVFVALIGSVLIGVSASANTHEVSKISKQTAKEIALKHADVKESDTTNLKVTLDIEDKVFVYEVEFNSGMKEYDYDIQVTNGTILNFDVDHIDE